MNKKTIHKSRRIQVMFTEAEGEMIDRSGKKLNLKGSKYINQIVVSFLKEGAFYVGSQDEKIEQNGTNNNSLIERKTIIGVANNLNQLLIYTHQNKALHSETESILKEIRKYFVK